MARPADTRLERTLPLSTDIDLRKRFMEIDEPVPGNLRFGQSLEVLDKLAEDTALLYVRRAAPDARVVTAAIDKIIVRSPADVSRDLDMKAMVNYTGKTSLEVGIRVEQPGDPPVHLASCYFTMVARRGEGEDAESLRVPPLDYLDDLDRRRCHRAVERREAFRLERAARLEPPSREEYDMLARLHAAQEKPEFSGLLVRDLVASAWLRVYPEHENVPKKIFGGYLVNRAYELASIAAERVVPDRAVCVAVNRINFHLPVRMIDTLHFTGRVVYTGRTSAAVEVEIERISRDRTTKTMTNSCAFTFVHVDRDLSPKPVPAIYPTTYVEDARYLEAYRRNIEHNQFRARQLAGRRRLTGS